MLQLPSRPSTAHICYVLPSTFKNMKHLLQPPAPVPCSKSSQIDHSENGKYLHDDAKGGSSKIDMDHSQNIQSCTCTPQNVEYPRSSVFTPAQSRCQQPRCQKTKTVFRRPLDVRSNKERPNWPSSFSKIFYLLSKASYAGLIMPYF